MKEAKKKKLKLKKKVIFEGIAFVITLISFYVIFLFFQLDILPFKYLGILLLFFCGIDFFLFFLMSKKNYKLRMLGSFLSILLLFSYGIMIHLEGRTLSFLETISIKKKQKESYYVVVKKNSLYHHFSDLNNRKISFVEDRDGIKKAMKEITKETSVKKDVKKDSSTLLNDLIEKKVDAIVMEKEEMNLYMEIGNFQEEVRVIETIDVEVEHKENKKEVAMTKEPFSIFVTGIDTYGEINKVSRSDVNMVITVNPLTHKVLLTSIPRDYYVQIYGTDGLKDKLTHAGLKGVETSMKTLESFLKTDINYFVKINFTSLVLIVDAIGGVDVENPFDFTANYEGPEESVYYEFSSGRLHLDGKKALAYVRERYCLREGDIARARHQQQVIEGMISKLTSSTILTKYTKLLSSIEGNFTTNLSLSNITGFIQHQLEENPSWSIETDVLSGDFSSEYTASFPNLYSEVILPNEASVEKSSMHIKNIKSEKN